MYLIFIPVFLCLFGCKPSPNIDIKRPETPICLVSVEDKSKAICGLGTGREDEDFVIDSLDVIGTTQDGYNKIESHLLLLENKIKSLQRRCK